MSARAFSLILLPTLRCNADCDYCFETKTEERLSLERLRILIDKVLDHLVAAGIEELAIHWQGGEIMTLPPSWLRQAYRSIEDSAQARGRRVSHGLQTNLIGYGPRWNDLIRTMFGNTLSTSLDYPNLYRHRRGRDAADYDAIWMRNANAARAAGIAVQVIAVPNAATLEIGAERFYSHFVETLGIRSFQVNTPFPGGEPNAVKRLLPLDSAALAPFFIALADVWLERGYGRGVRVGPFDELLAYFSGAPTLRPCIWTEDCANHMLAIDARGHVAQCDCWVASYPDYRFGNLFECDSLGDLLAASPVVERFRQRPMELVGGECIDCDYLALCHGGCPVRAFSVHGTLAERDPHCGLYRSLFAHMDAAAARLARGSALRTAVGSRAPSAPASDANRPTPRGRHEEPV